MNETIKIKSSVFLIVSRILAAIIIITLILTALFGMIDPRTQKQKDSDYRKEFLSKPHAQAAVEGLEFAYVHNLNNTPVHISVFNPMGKTYVCITFKDSIGQYISFYYDTSSDKEITSQEYDTAYNSIATVQNFVGNKKKIATTFEGEDLQIICEEVMEKWH